MWDREAEITERIERGEKLRERWREREKQILSGRGEAVGGEERRAAELRAES